MSFDISKLTGADGKPVSLEGVDAKVVAALGAIGSAITTQVETALGEGVKAAVTEALAPVTAQIEEIKKAKPADPSKPADPAKPGDTPDGEAVPAWAKTIIDDLTEIKTARQTETERAQTAARVKAYLDSKFPNLGAKARAVIEKRLIAAGPKDEAGLKAGVEAIKAEFTEVGIDVAKVFDADPEGEGAKTEPKDDKEREKQAKLELIASGKPLVKAG